MPRPGSGITAAVCGTASDIAASACRRGAQSVALDTSAISKARAAETEAADRASLASEIRAAVCDVLCAVVDENQPAVVKALKDRHARVVAKLVPASGRGSSRGSSSFAFIGGQQGSPNALSSRDVFR